MSTATLHISPRIRSKLLKSRHYYYETERKLYRFSAAMSLQPRIGLWQPAMGSRIYRIGIHRIVAIGSWECSIHWFSLHDRPCDDQPPWYDKTELDLRGQQLPCGNRCVNSAMSFPSLKSLDEKEIQWQYHHGITNFMIANYWNNILYVFMLMLSLSK